MPEFANDWFTPNIPFLTGMLKPIAHLPFKQGLEIGCFDGRSTCWFLENILDGEGSRIVCIDHFKGGADHAEAGISFDGVEGRFRRNTARWGDAVHLLVMDSSDALTEVSHPQYDFIYVDGSHTAPDVLRDAVLSWPFLVEGGIMIFDDYEWGNDRSATDRPKLGVDSFAATYREKLEIIGRGYQLAIKKIKP